MSELVTRGAASAIPVDFAAVVSEDWCFNSWMGFWTSLAALDVANRDAVFRAFEEWLAKACAAEEGADEGGVGDEGVEKPRQRRRLDDGVGGLKGVTHTLRLLWGGDGGLATAVLLITPVRAFLGLRVQLRDRYLDAGTTAPRGKSLLCDLFGAGQLWLHVGESIKRALGSTEVLAFPGDWGPFKSFHSAADAACGSLFAARCVGDPDTVALWMDVCRVWVGLACKFMVTKLGLRPFQARWRWVFLAAFGWVPCNHGACLPSGSTSWSPGIDAKDLGTTHQDFVTTVKLLQGEEAPTPKGLEALMMPVHAGTAHSDCKHKCTQRSLQHLALVPKCVAAMEQADCTRLKAALTADLDPSAVKAAFDLSVLPSIKASFADDTVYKRILECLDVAFRSNDDDEAATNPV